MNLTLLPLYEGLPYIPKATAHDKLINLILNLVTETGNTSTHHRQLKNEKEHDSDDREDGL